jgi:poly-beta-1,6-N-acetyl-D-glucosamine biosynthesis protein PgaD
LWLGFLYLIKDAFINLFRLGVETFEWVFLNDGPPDMPRFFGFATTLGLYALVALLNGAILMGWALYNQVRFQGRATRQGIAAVTPADLGKRFGATAEQVTEWQGYRAVVVSHDADGNLLAVARETARADALEILGSR